MFSRLVRTTRSVPRTSSAFRSFHASPPSNNDQGESAVAEEEDDNIGNDGVLGNLFGNPYTSIPLCGLGVMTATATDVSPYIFTPMFRIVLCATGKWCNCVKQWELRTQKKKERSFKKLHFFFFYAKPKQTCSSCCSSPALAVSYHMHCNCNHWSSCFKILILLFFLFFFFFLAFFQFYILDAETQLLGLWCMFVGTCYFNFSDPIANYFDDLAANVQKDQNAQEDLIIDAMEVTKGAHQRQTAIFEDIQAIYEAQKVVMESLVAAKTNELGHIVRASVVQKLDNVVTQESRMTATIQSNLVDAATEQVRTSVTGDRAKTMALENAFAAIADPTAASTGKDPVSSIYSKFFNDFNARLADASANETELSAELRAEMEAEMKSVAARDGLDFVNIAAPATMKL
jgi:hypothetical protein